MTYRRLIEDAGREWVRAEVIRSSGPERVHYAAEADPHYKPRPVGFLADLADPEPLLWNGDNA